MAIYNVSGDGHCILNAVICCLNHLNDPITLNEMKSHLVRFAYDQKEKYSQFMINTQPNQFYSAFLKYINDKTWEDDIGDLILLIVNEAFNIETNIVNVEYETVMSCNVIKNGNSNRRPRYTINLCKRGSHYDAIVDRYSHQNYYPNDNSGSSHLPSRMKRGNEISDKDSHSNSHRHSCLNCRRKIYYMVDQSGLPVPIKSGIDQIFLNGALGTDSYNRSRNRQYAIDQKDNRFAQMYRNRFY
jgi:hypothetical protein